MSMARKQRRRQRLGPRDQTETAPQTPSLEVVPELQDTVGNAAVQQQIQARQAAPETEESAQEPIPGHLGKFDAYDRGQSLGQVDIYEVDGVRMTAKTRSAWQEMKAAAAKAGVNLRLNSGFRTMQEQQDLYSAYQNGTGNLAAYPGHSNHQNGIALDIDVVSDASYDWIHANGPSFGFQRTVPSEPWHWEYQGG